MTPDEIRAARKPLVETIKAKRVEAERQIKEILRNLEADLDTSVDAIDLGRIHVHLLCENGPVSTVDAVHITLRTVA